MPVDLGPNAIRHVSKISQKLSSPSAFPFYRVEIWLSSVAVKVSTAIEETSPSVLIRGGATLTSTCVWVPGPILCSSVHEKVAAFHSSQSIPTDPRAEYIPVSNILILVCCLLI